MSSLFIIDDDPINNYLSENSIRKADSAVKIEVFTDPYIGVTTLNSIEFQTSMTLLLDINMPGLNGWDVMCLLEHKIDVYILTSSISPNDIEKSKNFPNIRGFISKPLSIDIGKQILNKTNMFERI